MKNFIGHIHDTRKLSNAQIEKAKETIKNLLHLDTVEIKSNDGEFYEVSTDDSNIVDFKIDSYNSDKISLVKYQSYDDDMKRDDAGAILTSADIKSKE